MFARADDDPAGRLLCLRPERDNFDRAEPLSKRGKYPVDVVGPVNERERSPAVQTVKGTIYPELQIRIFPAMAEGFGPAGIGRDGVRPVFKVRRITNNVIEERTTGFLFLGTKIPDVGRFEPAGFLKTVEGCIFAGEVDQGRLNIDPAKPNVDTHPYAEPRRAAPASEIEDGLAGPGRTGGGKHDRIGRGVQPAVPGLQQAKPSAQKGNLFLLDMSHRCCFLLRQVAFLFMNIVMCSQSASPDQAQPDLPPSSSVPPGPLQKLADLLHGDMKQVNVMILENMDSGVPLIPQLAGYLIAAGGKRIRPLLTLASASLFAPPDRRTYILAAAVEFIHSATLLHDDVVDVSRERRGRESANEIFGNKSSVLVGDYLFSRAFQLMVRTESLEVLRILSQASAVIAEGEVMQLSTTNNLETSRTQYLQVIKAKTAALFAAACEAGAVAAGADKDAQKALAAYGMALGIAFQIADDTLDYAADRETLGKTIGDDFREGKMTAPVLFALEGADESERAFWQRTLGGLDQTESDLPEAMKLIAARGALRKSMDYALEFVAAAQAALAPLPAGETKTLLYDMADYVVRRVN